MCPQPRAREGHAPTGAHWPGPSRAALTLRAPRADATAPPSVEITVRWPLLMVARELQSAPHHGSRRSPRLRLLPPYRLGGVLWGSKLGFWGHQRRRLRFRVGPRRQPELRRGRACLQQPPVPTDAMRRGRNDQRERHRLRSRRGHSLYNLVVYIPNARLDAFPQGVSCDQCGAVQSGSPLVSALTGPDGRFSLANVPVGHDIPLVMQVGKNNALERRAKTFARRKNALNRRNDAFTRRAKAFERRNGALNRRSAAFFRRGGASTGRQSLSGGHGSFSAGISSWHVRSSMLASKCTSSM